MNLNLNTKDFSQFGNEKSFRYILDEFSLGPIHVCNEGET